MPRHFAITGIFLLSSVPLAGCKSVWGEVRNCNAFDVALMWPNSVEARYPNPDEGLRLAAQSNLKFRYSGRAGWEYRSRGKTRYPDGSLREIQVVPLELDLRQVCQSGKSGVVTYDFVPSG